jgi:hypothetical protein
MSGGLRPPCPRLSSHTLTVARRSPDQARAAVVARQHRLPPCLTESPSTTAPTSAATNTPTTPSSRSPPASGRHPSSPSPSTPSGTPPTNPTPRSTAPPAQPAPHRGPPGGCARRDPAALTGRLTEPVPNPSSDGDARRPRMLGRSSPRCGALILQSVDGLLPADASSSWSVGTGPQPTGPRVVLWPWAGTPGVAIPRGPAIVPS